MMLAIIAVYSVLLAIPAGTILALNSFDKKEELK